jgi:hypothetical protein
MIEDREPGCVAVETLDDAMLVEDPLVDEAEPAGRRTRGGVGGVACSESAGTTGTISNNVVRRRAEIIVVTSR